VLLEKLRAKLLDIIHSEKDSLRIYHLSGDRDSRLEVYGRDKWIDLSSALVF
jgi:CRISPR/Cas system-associated endoribonuclease Cas2